VGPPRGPDDDLEQATLDGAPGEVRRQARGYARSTGRSPAPRAETSNPFIPDDAGRSSLGDRHRHDRALPVAARSNPTAEVRERPIRVLPAPERRALGRGVSDCSPGRNSEAPRARADARPLHRHARRRWRQTHEAARLAQCATCGSAGGIVRDACQSSGAGVAPTPLLTRFCPEAMRILEVLASYPVAETKSARFGKRGTDSSRR
jgi:hypothetical protein